MHRCNGQQRLRHVCILLLYIQIGRKYLLFYLFHLVFGDTKVQIYDEITDGGVFLSPSQSRIEGQAIIQKDNEIVEPIIIENL